MHLPVCLYLHRVCFCEAFWPVAFVSGSYAQVVHSGRVGAQWTNPAPNYNFLETFSDLFAAELSYGVILNVLGMEEWLKW
jgi:hypothetical protein